MPWKQGYTISDEISISDGNISWPGGNRLGVGITVDLSVASGPAGITKADIAYAPAYFAAHEGLDGILNLLARFGLKATFAVPAVIARAYPQRLRAIQAAGHEIAAEGVKHEDVSALAPEDEAARIDLATRILSDVMGQRPLGWFSLPRQNDPYAGGSISPNTMALLQQAGYLYMGNSTADDAPHYWVTDFAARSALPVLPYYYHFDDQWFLLFPKKGTGLEHSDVIQRNWRAEFDAQYRRGRWFHMVLHPQGSGWAHRLLGLERFFQHMAGHRGIWSATGTEAIRHWTSLFPPETHLRLQPSIWQDHEGSLS